MSSISTMHPAGRVRARKPQWVRASRWYLQVYVFLWTWMWIIVLPAAAIAMVVVDRVTGTVEISILHFVRYGPGIWMLFAVAIIVTAAYLPVHVANGMTRRSAVRGALVAALLGALLFGGAMSLAMLAEGAVYDALGWTQGVASDAEGASGVWEQGFGPMLLDHVLACLGGAVSGLLVGIAYYRLGGWLGTLALPLTVLPALAVTAVPSTDITLGSWVLPAHLAIGLTALLVLAAALAFALLARNVSIDRTES